MNTFTYHRSPETLFLAAQLGVHFTLWGSLLSYLCRFVSSPLTVHNYIFKQNRPDLNGIQEQSDPFRNRNICVLDCFYFRTDWVEPNRPNRGRTPTLAAATTEHLLLEVTCLKQIVVPPVMMRILHLIRAESAWIHLDRQTWETRPGDYLFYGGICSSLYLRLDQTSLRNIWPKSIHLHWPPQSCHSVVTINVLTRPGESHHQSQHCCEGKNQELHL